MMVISSSLVFIVIHTVQILVFNVVDLVAVFTIQVVINEIVIMAVYPSSILVIVY